MARLTKEEHDSILSQLADESNANEEMMNLVGRLREDFDESLSVDLEETERQWQERYDNMVSERDRAIGERDESRRAYRERFMGIEHGSSVPTPQPKIRTIDELLRGGN